MILQIVKEKEKRVEENLEEKVGDNDKETNKIDIVKDEIGAKYMQMERSVCFLDNAIFTVEVPVSEHKRLEIKEVKMKEIKNLEDYDTFELVVDVGQETIGSCWVIKRKEKHDGQKTEYKA